MLTKVSDTMLFPAKYLNAWACSSGQTDAGEEEGSRFVRPLGVWNDQQKLRQRTRHRHLGQVYAEQPGENNQYADTSNCANRISILQKVQQLHIMTTSMRQRRSKGPSDIGLCAEC